MNLSKRSLTVIVPVLLLTYAVAAASVYLNLRQSLTHLEQNRLDLEATKMASSFTQYSNFAESYLVALTENESFRALIHSADDEYLRVALGASIEKLMSSFSQHQSSRYNVTMVNINNLKELYYFEYSDDPFTQISDEQKSSYERLIGAGLSSGWDLVTDKSGKSTIVVSRVVDRLTYRTPIKSQFKNSILIQFGIEPTQFLKMKQDWITAHDGRVKIVPENHMLAQGLTSASSLGKGITLQVSLPEDYMDGVLLTTQLLLMVTTLLFFVFSSFVLWYLVRKYITGPIQALENELSLVTTEGEHNLKVIHHQDDEIGRLEKVFHKIYGDLLGAFSTTKELAEHDVLTKLHNLTYVSDKAHKALLEASKNNQKVALIYIDLDNFKFVNDKHGHEVGDELLKAFASRLITVVRQADLVTYESWDEDVLCGRIAGDEFSVLVTNYKDDSVPEKVAKRILSIFDQRGFTFEKGTFPISASIGVSVYPDDGVTLSELVSNADNAMYQAKNAGKNNISFFSQELANSTRRRMDIEHELKSFNPDDEFYLVYMPLVCMKTNRIDGFEVLLRWMSPKLGFVGPDEFVPIAESSGLFDKIDSWVVEQSLKSYRYLKTQLGRDFKLSINLSSAQLDMNDMAEQLGNLARKFDINPSFIQLELTETLNVEFTTKAAQLLQSLCAAGFQIAIDDFGTGYTALMQLIEYPAQMIKFDKTFVDKAMKPDNRSMLEPLISLCHSQGLQVTVEGVETDEMAEYLKSIGADYLQGYYYGAPARINELDLTLHQTAS